MMLGLGRAHSRLYLDASQGAGSLVIWEYWQIFDLGQLSPVALIAEIRGQAISTVGSRAEDRRITVRFLLDKGLGAERL